MLEKCVWKILEEDKNSTSFIDARKDPSSGLYQCIACNGYNGDCKSYRVEKPIKPIN